MLWLLCLQLKKQIKSAAPVQRVGLVITGRSSCPITPAL